MVNHIVVPGAQPTTERKYVLFVYVSLQPCET
jgi:hypothetical protein